MGAALIDGEVAARCHANCVEYAREGARRSGPAGEIVERDGVLLFASASDFPVFANGAFRLDPTASGAGAGRWAPPAGTAPTRTWPTPPRRAG